MVRNNKIRIARAGTIIGAMALLGGASVASAADLPRKSVPAQTEFQRPLPIFTWTGFYIGAVAGYDFNAGTSRLTGTPGLLATGFVPLGKLKTSGNGFAAGGTIGYNFQSGNVVTGLEADLSYLGLGKRVTTVIAPLTTSVSQNPNYLGTVRARLGYAFDRLMVYGTGGLAYGDTKSNLNITGLASEWSGSKNATRFGWTAGAGVEYALTNNWSVKAEYLYYDLGKTTVNAPLVSGAGAGAGVSGVARSENKGNIVRAGINYRF